jgi:ELWxxDGT repeat protein
LLALALTLLTNLNGAGAAVQEPYLVRDINPSNSASSPAGFVWVQNPLRDSLFFSANDGVHGHELWMSDGTPAGTALVKDIWPGPDHAYPGFLVSIGSVAFFSADDGRHGYELWRSDGTEEGTQLVKDINPGKSHSYPGFLIELNGTLFFRADDGEHGYELWKSDGTRSGTIMVKDIQPGQTGSTPQNLTSVGLPGFQAVLFHANDGEHGIELWKSDGTGPGTILLRDIAPGPDDSGPGSLAVIDSSQFQGVLFAADDSTASTTAGSTVREGHGEELWRSDGTPAGTELVKDINPGQDGSQPGTLAFVQGTQFQGVLFGARDGLGGHGYELWKSDGTAEGTNLVKDINPGPADSNPCRLTVMTGPRFQGVLFCADDGASGPDLWRSNGTAAGTALVKDINPGPAGSSLTSLLGLRDRAYFSADDGAPPTGHGPELWATDGTGAGTVLIEDINPGGDGSYPAFLTMVGGSHPHRLFFRAEDSLSGRELWAMEISALQHLPIIRRP